MPDIAESPLGLGEDQVQERQGFLSDSHPPSAGAGLKISGARRFISVGSLVSFALVLVLWRSTTHPAAHVRGSTLFVQLEAAGQIPTYPYSAWSGYIKDGTCSTSSSPLAIDVLPKNGKAQGKITCALEKAGKVYRFPAGIFEIDEQLLVPEHTAIIGANNPNDLSDPLKQPAWEAQTLFLATRGATDSQMNYCFAPDMVTTRVGFVLSSYTSVMDLSYQGIDIVRPMDNGGLCGGGVFETKGCAQNDCGSDVNNGGSDGECSADVSITNVRLNAFYWNEDQHLVGATVPGNQECTYCMPNNIRSSQVGVWVPACRSAEGTQDVTIDSVVSLSNQADGINLHGKVNNAKVINNYFQNAGDDIYALWGAESNPTNILFKDSVAVNPGVLRPNWYGVCVATYGLQSVTFDNITCRTPMNWEGTDNIDVSMFFFHTSFGGSYPEGHTVTMNKWTFTDLEGQPYNPSDGNDGFIARGKMTWMQAATNVAAPYFADGTQFVNVLATP